ncbi:Uncharacterized protein At3g49140 [Linum perenne]
MMMLMMIDSAAASRFAAGANLCSSAAPLSSNFPVRRLFVFCHFLFFDAFLFLAIFRLGYKFESFEYRGAGSLEELRRVSGATRHQLRTASFDLPWKKSHTPRASSISKRSVLLNSTIRASAGQLSSGSDPSEQNGKAQYHPFEEISDSASKAVGDARLTAEETCRTMVEVNCKATLMLNNLFNEQIHENVMWPDIPYVTDEYGNIYFQVKNDEDILRTLTSENDYVQAIIGFDSEDMANEMELLENNGDFEFDDSDEEDSDGEEDSDDDDYDEDIEAILEEDSEDDDDDDDDDEDDVGDWANLETMDSSHPMYFAKRLTQVASDDPIDWMKQPPTGLSIQGILRPALGEEHTDIKRHMSGDKSSHDKKQAGKEADSSKKQDSINGQNAKSESTDDVSVSADELAKDAASKNRTTFYKLETTKIQLISADGRQTTVEPDVFRRAKPDAIAHSADKIISRLKDAGQNVTEALISLCWRCKDLQVEEAAVTGLDSLGFDLRVCSGTQVQTLRFAFNSRATSEYSAERQLNDLLFPLINHSPLKKETQQNEH